MTTLDTYLSGPYILNTNHEPVLVTPDEAKAWEHATRRDPDFFTARIVEHTDVRVHGGDETVRIHTDFQVSPLPDLTRGVWCFFETMVFGGALADLAWQWETWDDAVTGHRLIVEMATHVHDFRG